MPLLFEPKAVDSISVERSLWKQGYRLVAGVDEAGRGPLAGPVVAAAVIIDESFDREGIDDSKKLSAKQREALYPRICRQAVACAVDWGIPDQIDEINILGATKKAMCGALNKLGLEPDYVLVDGNQKLSILTPQRTLIKGDSRSVSIAAASILAKVTRDMIMAAYHWCWPIYGFDHNAGYGTRMHLNAIAEHGPCPIHRRTFGGVKEHLAGGE